MMVFWMPVVRKIPFFKRSPANVKTEDASENVPLLDDQRRKRCCFGMCRMYGPDSAWSWLVAFSNFLISFLIVGLGRMSGILYIELMDTFGVDRMTASIPFSVQQAASNLFGPLAGIVGQKYGLRNMTIFGGVVAYFGATVVFFKMDMTYIIIFWGLLFGIGTAFTTTLNQISIDRCFDRNRATAGGFAVSGGSVGAFILPFVLETSIAHFDLRATFLLLGSFILFTIPAAFMLVDPPWKEFVKTESNKQKNVRRYGSIGGVRKKVLVGRCNSNFKKSTKELIETNRHKSRIDFPILRANRDIVVQLLTSEISNGSTESITDSSQEDGKFELVNKLEQIYSIIEDLNGLSRTPSTSQTSIDSAKVGTESEKKSSADINSDDEMNSEVPFLEHFLSERELFPIQSKLQKLYERGGSRIASSFHFDDQPRVCKIITELRKLYEILTDEPGYESIYNKAQYFRSSKSGELDVVGIQKDPRSSDSLCSHLITAIRLHKNPVFLLICLSRAVFMLTFVPVVTIVVDFAMDQGMEKSYGKYAVSALSLGDLFGRLCFGWVTDRKYLSQPQYTLIAMILLGGNSVALPFLHSGVAILVAILTYGILQGSLFVRHPMLVSKFMTSREQSIGMGCINLLSGILGFALPAFIGYFRDYLGSYDEMFFFNGIICVAVGLFWGLEHCFPKTSEKVEDRYQHL